MLRVALPALAALTGAVLLVSGLTGIAGAVGTAGAAGIIITVGGGPGGPAAGRTVSVNQPCGVTADRSPKGLYVTDEGNDLVRRLNLSSGVLGTVAGVGPTGGPRSLSSPCAVTTDRAGNVIFAGGDVRVIAARNGTFYGMRMRAGHSYVVGGTSFAAPVALAVDSHGNLLVASQTTQGDGDGGTAVVSVLAGAKGTFYGQHMVPGRIYPLAGQECPGGPSGGCAPGLSGDGGPALDATFGQALWGLAVDRHGNVLISDSGDNVVRVIAAASAVCYGVSMTAGDIYSIAGGGPGGGTDGLGDGGPASQATLSSPHGLVIDGTGNVIIADTSDGRVRVVAAATGRFYGQQMTSGDIYTIAGGGTSGPGTDSPAIQARLVSPAGVSFDSAGNLAIADQGSNRLRLVAERSGTFYRQKVTAGHIYTIAGNGHASYSGNGGLATDAQMSLLIPGSNPGVPVGKLAVGPDGSIVIADTSNNVVRVIAGRTGMFYGMKLIARHIYTVAGTGVQGFRGDDGPAIRARLCWPGAVAVDHAGNILVGDECNLRIRVIANRTGTFYGQRMTAGDIYTIAGPGTAAPWASGIPAITAGSSPSGLAVDRNGNVIVANGVRVKVIAERTGTFYGIHMKAGYLYILKHGGPSNTAQDVAIDHAGNLVVVSGGYSQIGVIAVRAGTFYGIKMYPHHFYPVAGNGTSGFSGDGGRAMKAELNAPDGVAVDAAGNLLIADSGNNRVRVVAERSGTFYGVKMKAGHIYTVAGNGKAGYSGYGGRATSAELNDPCGVAAYGNNILVLDNGNDRVREVSG